MYKQPKVSIVIPYHDMKNAEFFLKRNIDSIMSQTFKDYEIILTKDGKMAENTNSGLRQARGEFIKILYLDDYFSNELSLVNMVNNIDRYRWLICGTNNNPNPMWTSDIERGNNKLGSPSAMMFRNKLDDNLLFDEKMSWLLDCDYYIRMQERYGIPNIIWGDFVSLGQGDHQMTHILTDEEKLAEYRYMNEKYA